MLCLLLPMYDCEANYGMLLVSTRYSLRPMYCSGGAALLLLTTYYLLLVATCCYLLLTTYYLLLTDYY